MEGEYYKTKETAEEYIRLAKDVNGKALIDRFKNHIKPGCKLLELGSGPGSDFELLKDDFDVTGSDNSLEFLRHLNTKFPKGKFLELDAETIETTEQFDAIYANKVLHHLSDEALRNSIRRQSEVLNSGGFICLSFWAGEGSEEFKGMFVNYHSKEDLQAYFGGHFDLLVLEPYLEFEKDDSLFLIGRKK